MDLQKFIQKPIYNLEEKFTNLGLWTIDSWENI